MTAGARVAQTLSRAPFVLLLALVAACAPASDESVQHAHRLTASQDLTHRWTYAYDPAGNRTERLRTSLSDPLEQLRYTYAYDDADQYAGATDLELEPGTPTSAARIRYLALHPEATWGIEGPMTRAGVPEFIDEVTDFSILQPSGAPDQVLRIFFRGGEGAAASVFGSAAGAGHSGVGRVPSSVGIGAWFPVV